MNLSFHIIRKKIVYHNLIQHNNMINISFMYIIVLLKITFMLYINTNRTKYILLLSKYF